MQKPSVPAQPVTNSEFLSLMNALGPLGPDEAGSPIALAVSGGGDSMALACLARTWRKHIIAFIVDHALRPESRQEAELTGKRLASTGVPFRILTLKGLKAGGLQEQARNARYDLLEQACHDVGASFLMLAHHEADQEETLWMRLERKTGLEGMTGMAPRSYRGQLTLLRPFLTVRPERLKETLRKKKIEWCEDPSNRNRRFKRVQVRQDLSECDRAALREKQTRSVLQFQAMERHVSALLGENIQMQPEGWMILPSHVMTDLSSDVRHFLLARLIRHIGGGAYLPSSDSVKRLLEKGEGSLGGVVMKKRFSHAHVKDFILYREFRGVQSLEIVQKGVIWDRRWLYQGDNMPDCRIDALGEQASAVRIDRQIPFDVLKTVPAIWRKEQLMAVAEGVRAISPNVVRVPFLWQGGMKIVGAKLFY